VCGDRRIVVACDQSATRWRWARCLNTHAHVSRPPPPPKKKNGGQLGTKTPDQTHLICENQPYGHTLSSCEAGLHSSKFMPVAAS